MIALQQEREAQEHTKKQLATLLKFEDKKARYRKSFIVWDGLERANKKKESVHRKSSKISKNASALMAPVIQTLKRGKRFVVNHKYITSITNTDKRQNLNIINELQDVFDITYHAHIIVNGKSHYRSYEFVLKQLLQENKEPLDKEMTKLISSSPTLNTNEQALLSSSIENNNTESIRSKVQVHESNFLQNSQSKKIEENTTSELPKFLKILLKNKKCLPNQRKKPNSQERKAKIYSPKFKQYDKPKNLSEHYPLTTEECSELQSCSGREFTLNAMNEILLDMSRKPKESKHKFPSKAAFMAYMSKVYRYEERDAVKTANTGFKIVARATEAEIIQHTTQTERESYLNLIEQQAITHRSDENQLKAKWANTLPTNTAYNLLLNLSYFHKVGITLEVQLRKHAELTEYQKTQMLHDIQAVGGYGDIEEIEFIL